MNSLIAMVMDTSGRRLVSPCRTITGEKGPCPRDIRALRLQLPPDGIHCDRPLIDYTFQHLQRDVVGWQSWLSADAKCEVVIDVVMPIRIGGHCNQNKHACDQCRP